LQVAARTDPSSSMIDMIGGLDKEVLPEDDRRVSLAMLSRCGRVRRKSGLENHT
jgi:hypothetical protein